MNRVTAILAAALIAASLAAAPGDAAADTAGGLASNRVAANLARDVKSARVETSGTQTFILNGRRIHVPADENAEAIVRILKARYPELKADTAARR